MRAVEKWEDEQGLSAINEYKKLNSEKGKNIDINWNDVDKAMNDMKAKKGKNGYKPPKLIIDKDYTKMMLSSLKLNYRYDVRGNKSEVYSSDASTVDRLKLNGDYLEKTIDGWNIIDDMLEDNVYCEVEKEHHQHMISNEIPFEGNKLNVSDFRTDFSALLGESRYDPFKDWLQSLVWGWKAED